MQHWGESLLSMIALLRSLIGLLLLCTIFCSKYALASVSLCVHACMHGFVCLQSKKNMARSINTKLGTRVPYGSGSEYFDWEVKRSNVRVTWLRKPSQSQTVTDAWLLVAVCCTAARVGCMSYDCFSFYSSSVTDGRTNLSRRHAVYTCNAGGHEAGHVACNQGSGHHLCEVRLTRWSHSVQRSQVHADCAETSDTTQHVR